MPNNNPSGAGAFDFPLRFPGQYFDRETNLAYNLLLMKFDVGNNQDSQEEVHASALDLHFKDGKASPLGFPIFCILPLRRYPTVVLPLVEISAADVNSALNDAILHQPK